MIWTSIIGILTLVGLAWALGFTRSARLDGAEDAAARATLALAGFQPAAAVLSAHRDAALVATADGRIALVRSFGDRFIVRPLAGIRARAEGGILHLHLPEPGLADVRLDLGAEAGRWAARL